jgi:hypothetical protein
MPELALSLDRRAPAMEPFPWLKHLSYDAFLVVSTLVCGVAARFLASPAHGILTGLLIVVAFFRVLTAIEDWRYRRAKRRWIERR